MLSSDLAPSLIVVGRVLLGFLFVAGAISHVIMFAAIADVMKRMGVHFPQLTLAAGTAFQIVAGVLLMVGLFVVPAALGLIVFTIAASIMMLPFWNMAGEPRLVAFNNWLSNIGIVGGLLVTAAQGPL